MSQSIEEAFADLHNLHVREALRRFQPQEMLVAVDVNDSIVKTMKFKSTPELVEIKNFSADCKGTAIFAADTKICQSLDQFQLAVKRSGDAIRRRQAGITDDPNTYYVGRK